MASPDDSTSFDLTPELWKIASTAVEDLYDTASGNIQKMIDNPDKFAEELADNIKKTVNDPEQVANFVGGGAGTIKGVLAKTWNADAARVAASKLAGDVHPANVWRETRTYLNPIDKKFRQEIDDMPAKLKTAVDKEMQVSLEKFLEHPELFKAYPQLKETLVNLKPELGREGSFLPATLDYPGVITVGGKDTRSVLIHEIQHAIQQIEGFSKGTNLEKAAKYIEKNAPAQLIRASKLEKSKGAELSPAARVELDRTISKFRQIAEERPINTYKRSPGENESFMVQKRLDYLPEERRLRPPFMDNLMAWEQMLKDL